jgi:hypothetical protein
MRCANRNETKCVVSRKIVDSGAWVCSSVNLRVGVGVRVRVIERMRQWCAANDSGVLVL